MLLLIALARAPLRAHADGPPGDKKYCEKSPRSLPQTVKWRSRKAVSRKARDFWVFGAQSASPDVIRSTKDDF